MKNFSRILLVLFALTILARGAPKIPSIRSIDFKTFSFPWDDDTEHLPSYGASPWHWLMAPPESRIRVLNAAYHFYEPGPSQLQRRCPPLVRVHAVASP